MKFTYIALVFFIGLAGVQCAKVDKVDFMQAGLTEENAEEEAAAEEETTTEDAYDGNIYNLEDPTFHEEVTLEILADVESGDVTSDQAIAQFAVMYEDEWMNEAEYEWASEEAQRLEEQLNTTS